MDGLSEERLAPANGIEIAYQEIGDRGGEPLLLIMGLGMQMLGWHEEFCAMLAERGFRVVRFDNRDIGRSTKIDSAGVPSRLDMVLGRRSTAPYLLRDMAADTTGLMDHLEIESAHVVGASMGGMIAQTLAIESPERVRSLVSMMSTTGNRRVGRPAPKTFGTLMAHPAPGRDGAIEQAVRTFRVIGSPGYPMDEQHLREVGGRLLRPQPQPGRGAAPDARDHGFRRPHVRPPRAATADDGDPRWQGPPDQPVRRPRHRQGDPRRPSADLRGHGPRPPASPLGELRRGDRRHRGSRRRQAARLRPPLRAWIDAAERSRTSTEFPPHGPEPCASTSSATAAGGGNLPVGSRRPPGGGLSLDSRLLAAIV